MIDVIDNRKTQYIFPSRRRLQTVKVISFLDPPLDISAAYYRSINRSGTQDFLDLLSFLFGMYVRTVC